jgi:hypothetical protein
MVTPEIFRDKEAFMGCKKSKRNRHIGKINAAKRRVIDRGKAVKSLDGKTYMAFTEAKARGPMIVRIF